MSVPREFRLVDSAIPVEVLSYPMMTTVKHKGPLTVAHVRYIYTGFHCIAPMRYAGTTPEDVWFCLSFNFSVKSILFSADNAGGS